MLQSDGLVIVASMRDSRGTIDPRELGRMFSPPRWLHDLGVAAWLVLGVGLVLFGVIWLLGETETIVLPVVTGTIVAAVAGPAVSTLALRGVPRAAGAALVLLGLLALAIVVLLLVLHGIVARATRSSRSPRRRPTRSAAGRTMPAPTAGSRQPTRRRTTFPRSARRC